MVLSTVVVFAMASGCGVLCVMRATVEVVLAQSAGVVYAERNAGSAAAVRLHHLDKRRLRRAARYAH